MQWHLRRLNIRSPSLGNSHSGSENFSAFLEHPKLQSWVRCWLLCKECRGWQLSACATTQTLSEQLHRACTLAESAATAICFSLLPSRFPCILALQSGSQGPKKDDA